MKTLVGILLCLSLMVVMGCTQGRYFLSSDTSYIPTYVPNENCKLVSFKPGVEPQGVNGIKWETQLVTLQEMKPYRKDPSHGGIDFYLRADEGYKLKNGKPIRIQYGFWRGKFYCGVITTENASDWEPLKETVFERFGVGAKPFSNQEEYLWIGKDATMGLRYDTYSKTGTLYMRSHSLEKQMN
jgi:hypothetical protein